MSNLRLKSQKIKQIAKHALSLSFGANSNFIRKNWRKLQKTGENVKKR